ncbi:MAG: hypothetical protein ACPG4T_17505, partial [Nannocystaceae bacterium]
MTPVSLQLFETVEPEPGEGYWVQVPEIVTEGRRYFATYEPLSLARTEVVAKLNFSEDSGNRSLTLPIMSEGIEIAREVNSRPDLLSDQPDTFWMEFSASSQHELEKLKLRARKSDSTVTEFTGPLYYADGPTERLLLAALPGPFNLSVHNLESRRVDSKGGELDYDLPEVFQIVKARRKIEGYINVIEVPKALKELQRKKVEETGAGGAKDLIRA